MVSILSQVKAYFFLHKPFYLSWHLTFVSSKSDFLIVYSDQNQSTSTYEIKVATLMFNSLSSIIDTQAYLWDLLWLIFHEVIIHHTKLYTNFTSIYYIYIYS